jgi:hypothetical protein
MQTPLNLPFLSVSINPSQTDLDLQLCKQHLSKETAYNYLFIKKCNKGAVCLYINSYQFTNTIIPLRKWIKGISIKMYYWKSIRKPDQSSFFVIIRMAYFLNNSDEKYWWLHSTSSILNNQTAKLSCMLSLP